MLVTYITYDIYIYIYIITHLNYI